MTAPPVSPLPPPCGPIIRFASATRSACFCGPSGGAIHRSPAHSERHNHQERCTQLMG
jgi:hypothetical protein